MEGIRRPPRRRAWVGLTALVVAATVATLYYLEHRGVLATGLFGALSGTPHSIDSIFPVTLGEETFVVSGRHLRRIQRSNDGSVQQIDLALPWPAALEDILSEEADPLDETRVSSTIFMAIQRRDMVTDAAERFERIYPRYLLAGAARELHGLTAQEFSEDCPYHGQELLSRELEDGTEYVLRCDIPKVDMLPSICRRQFVAAEGFAVIYRFHRDHLADWRDIEDTVAKYYGQLREQHVPGS